MPSSLQCLLIQAKNNPMRLQELRDFLEIMSSYHPTYISILCILPLREILERSTCDEDHSSLSEHLPGISFERSNMPNVESSATRVFAIHR
jgi:hypothetical protein